MADPVHVVSTAASPACYAALALYGISSLVYMSAFVDSPNWLRRAGVWIILLAFVAHGADISWRGFQSVHPGTSIREALGFLAWVFVGIYLFWARKSSLSVLGAFVAPGALIALALARLTPSGEGVTELSTLGRVHISLATLGVALFTLATIAAAAYLVQERALKRKKFGGFWFKSGAALDTLDLIAHRLVVVGYPIFTVSLMLGVLWVSQRQSSLARPEYLVALATWLCFGLLIVGRTVKGWRGRKAAYLTILGFLTAGVVLAIYFVRRAMGA